VLTDEGIETNFATNPPRRLPAGALAVARASARGTGAHHCGLSSSVHSRIKMVDLTSVVTGAPLTPDSWETSKLLNILFIKELARRLQGTRITPTLLTQVSYAPTWAGTPPAAAACC
jgi:NAD(P)-dependent dehydrogenase (short-subunit alcohol dehydrogenase family)